MTKKTIPQKLAKLLPPFIREWVRIFYLLHGLKAKLRWDGDISAWIVHRPFSNPDKKMPVVVRSFKEFRRIAQFGKNQEDIVYRWLHAIKDCKVFYDIGAANGLEGFLCHHLHDSKVCFVEPFTASIETIMRNVYVLAKRDGSHDKFEVVHAGANDQSYYDRAFMLCPPKAGETQISFSDPNSYERRGRVFNPVTSQWVFGISIDEMHMKYKMDVPTHVKIDVDGFEHRVINGAINTIKSQDVISWAIEITGEENLTHIDKIMTDNGYEEIARWEHYPGLPARTFDIIYSLPAHVDYFKKAILTIRAY
jgi:FkbM family methyltransferase